MPILYHVIVSTQFESPSWMLLSVTIKIRNKKVDVFHALRSGACLVCTWNQPSIRYIHARRSYRSWAKGVYSRSCCWYRACGRRPAGRPHGMASSCFRCIITICNRSFLHIVSWLLHCVYKTQILAFSTQKERNKHTHTDTQTYTPGAHWFIFAVPARIGNLVGTLGSRRRTMAAVAGIGCGLIKVRRWRRLLKTSVPLIWDPSCWKRLLPWPPLRPGPRQFQPATARCSVNESGNCLPCHRSTVAALGGQRRLLADCRIGIAERYVGVGWGHPRAAHYVVICWARLGLPANTNAIYTRY